MTKQERDELRHLLSDDGAIVFGPKRLSMVFRGATALLDEVERLERAYSDAIRVVRAIEWIPAGDFTLRQDGQRRREAKCPDCGAQKTEGEPPSAWSTGEHLPECDIATLLAGKPTPLDEREEIARLRALLREVEWGWDMRCGICGGMEPEAQRINEKRAGTRMWNEPGHAKGCRLAAELGEG